MGVLTNIENFFFSERTTGGFKKGDENFGFQIRENKLFLNVSFFLNSIYHLKGIPIPYHINIITYTYLYLQAFL